MLTLAAIMFYYDQAFRLQRKPDRPHGRVVRGRQEADSLHKSEGPGEDLDILFAINSSQKCCSSNVR